MKTGRIVLFLIVLSILWCADVFAHDDGNPVAHFCPGTSNDPCMGNYCLDMNLKVDTGMLIVQLKLNVLCQM